MPSSVKSMGRREDALHKFENERIKTLQEERMHIQKKTFTKWMNSFLLKARLEVRDLFTDLADGRMLLKLLEIISGEKLGKPNNGKMRVHKVENVNKSLAFLQTKVRLESIGAEDIVDGNPRLILGLIWTIILRFQIQEIEIKLDEENESSEKKSAKDALLLWCQRRTAGYRGVAIHDFSGSWRNGLGFNALIHAHRPDLIQFNDLKPENHIENLNNAFSVAHSNLGVARILDAEDIDMNKPDEKSIITYVASYYHTFAKMRDEMKGSRRIANIVSQMKGVDDSKDHYSVIMTSLLEWIRVKVSQLNDRGFPNTLDGIQRLLIQFGKYRTEEKPPKYIERSEIEALLFSINTRLKELRQPSYSPADGHTLHDLQSAWQELEKAEHAREVALREELLRQERLQQLAYKFERKSLLRKTYLQEMMAVLSDERYGSSLGQVHATVKKHEAISADILARKERFADLSKMADELERETYHSAPAIRLQEQQIMKEWRTLLELLERHQETLQRKCVLMNLITEVETLQDNVNELHANFSSSDVGAHLMAVEDLLQKHSIMERQMQAMGDAIDKLQSQTSSLSAMKDIHLLENALKKLTMSYKALLELAKKRRARLEEARNLYQFLADIEEEEAWVIERQRICQTAITAKDLRAVTSLLQKHKTLEDEMRASRPKAQKIERFGRGLISENHPDSKIINEHVTSLSDGWKNLDKMVAERRKQLQDALEAYSFYADANEAESWVKEKQPLVESKDFGEDEPSGHALLQRHARLEEEVNAYKGDIAALQQQGNKLMSAGITTLSLNKQTTPSQPETNEQEEEFEMVEETQLVPEEIVEEVPQEYIQEKYVTTTKMMPTVKAKFPFDGQGMSMVKGEEMFLLSKTNSDWWNIRKKTGEEGFVPANYVREGEPKEVQLKMKQMEKKIEMKREVKKILSKKTVMVKRRKPRAPPRNKKVEPEIESETVEERLKAIADSYNYLLSAAQKRRLLLLDAIALFAFYGECAGADQWMRDKEKMLKDDDSSATDVEGAKRKFEKFLTDLSAARKRIDKIDAMVDEFGKNGHSQLSNIRARQKQIHDHWDHLDRLKKQKERSLEGASSVELFNRTCQETKDWMIEKMEKLDTDELGRDLKTIQSLQRKHDQLERELAPVEEKVNHVKMLGNSVQSSYPNERKMVDVQVAEVNDLWSKVKNSAGDRRNRLQEAVGKQIFFSSAKALLGWVSSIKVALNSSETASDVTTAELLLKAHQDLGDDIRAHEDEFKEIHKLGAKLGSQGDVGEKMEELREEQDAIQRGWQEKEDWLRQCLDLQLFNREADQIDVATNGHEAFLDYKDCGSTLDDVEALLKRHGELESTLIAQNERIATFNDTADKLIEANHYDADKINDKRVLVLQKRDAVRMKADERRQIYLNSLEYQKFKADADDFAKLIEEKQKLANDESYRELTNLERKLQKHEAFQRELHSNEGQLRNINDVGNGLIASDHFRKDDVIKTLDELNSSWKKLWADSAERGRKLLQANDQHNYNKNLEEAGKTLNELENVLKAVDVGSDLRSCKQQMINQSNVDNDMKNMEKKINEMHNTGQIMAQNDHFDATNIMKNCNQLEGRFQSLKGPAEARRAALNESLKFYQFGFQVDAEKQWINEHLPLASSEVIGQDLHEAQKLQKKHRKLEAELQGHQTMIDKTVQQGDDYIKENHPESAKIELLCNDLKESWSHLRDCAAKRQQVLDLSLKAQQYFFEANEIESWMAEKRNILTTNDYGRNEDISRKLLAKHKAIELEIDSYTGLVKEMGLTADGLVKTNHPESRVIKERQQLVNHELKSLQKLSANLRTKLMESMYRHEYMREADELENWIADQMQTATSQDYGQDYEHLVILQAKFADFKHRVEAGYERFNQCEDLAKKLVANESPYTQDIENNQDKLRAKWNALLDEIASRDEKLEAAGDIHRFNRDVAEALFRIQEKNKAISDDLGRDVHSVQGLIRKHEGFENDLVALEAQLQVLVDDCSRLQTEYPGPNSANLASQQTKVLSEWDVLQDRAATRKQQLIDAAKLHAFMAQSRDLLSWSCDLRSTMKAQEKVRDATSAQALKTEHDGLKLEIEAREDVFSSVVQNGNQMVEDKHYASSEIADRAAKVLEERNQLHAAWQHKKVYLDQLIDLQFFLRDAKHLDATSATQEAALSIVETPTTINEVQRMVTKHDAFEKLVDAQNEKLDALKNHGGQLIQQNHFYSSNIKSRIEEVAERRDKVKQATAQHKMGLQDALLYAQFINDVTDADAWITEKTNHLELERQKGEVTSFEDKVKKLQKHQAFIAELQAHESMMKDLISKGEMLLQKRHASSPEIKKQVDDLVERWTHLDIAAGKHSRGLEEAQDILSFNTEVEKVDSWIRDKMLLVQAHDLGRDYEHCTALMRKLDDMDSDMRVDDAKFVNINRLCDKIVSQTQVKRDNDLVLQKRNDLNNKWAALKGALDQYRQDLGGALEVHAFNRDVDDTTERISEKSALLSGEETGRNLVHVETLKRKQDNILRDMSAIETKIRDHEKEASRLSRKYPTQKEDVSAKFVEVQQAWSKLVEDSNYRNDKLGAAFTFQKFMSELRELEKWSDSIIGKMSSAPLPNNTTEATSLLHAHQEKKAEIDGRRQDFKSLKQFGEKLVSEGHSETALIQENIVTLETVLEKVSSEWNARQNKLTEANQLQLFLNLANLASDWLADQEAFLNNQDLGESLGTVDVLMRKHVQFENSFGAQGSKVDQLEKLGSSMLSSNHYDSAGIRSKMNEVTEKRQELLSLSKVRGEKLKMSKDLQQFLRNVYEVESWIGEKLQVALDESYLDPSNLQSKKQKHQAFESEILANSSRLDVVLQEGSNLIEKKHYAVHEIQARMDTLESQWQQLQDSSVLKRERLHQAYQALLFSRTLDDLDSWMDEVETALTSEDHGKDFTSANTLINKNQKLMQDVTAHGAEIEQCQEVCKSFEAENHFMAPDISDRTDAVVKRYEALHEPLQIRGENLSSALLLHQLLRDIDEELLWIHEKTPLATSSELGNSLPAVQQSLKKHQALEAEVVSHEPVISSVVSRAQQMIRSGHFASEDVSARSDHLTKTFQKIKDDASVRKLRLLDAQEVQTFYTELSEVEGLLREKRPQVMSQDFGKDEDSTQTLMKKLDTTTRDVKSFTSNIEKLSVTANKLIERNHFDSENISKRMASVQREQNELGMLCEQRSRRLGQSLQMYIFLRRADMLLEQLNEQMTIAASEDYGRDVEHIELLIQKFESFLSSMASNDQKISDIKTEADKLLEDKHPEPHRIQGKWDDVNQLWEDLRELSAARQEALTGAKQVHVFDRDADETISWIIEKDSVMSSEDFGNDLESIQSLARKHQGFERDLAAVKEQVQSVVTEAERLTELFPDAAEHISVKHLETVEAWSSLLEKSALRKDKLHQREKLQSYFGVHGDLLAWIMEMRAKVTAPDLPKEVLSAEAIITKNDEYKVEIDSRASNIKQFTKEGNALIDQGHFMAEEIADKIVSLEDNWKVLLECWQRRDVIYQRNLDVRVFLRDASIIESWIENSESVVRDEDLGSSIEEVEELIRRHNDFIKTVEAQEDKLDPVKRVTKLETDFASLRQKEEEARREEEARKENERMEAMKRKEVHRITEERRREDERRKTQEIKFTKEDMDAVRLKMNGDYPPTDDDRLENNEVAGLQRAGSYTSLSSLKRGNSFRTDMFRTTMGLSDKNDPKKAKRTPSFTTRRRTQSFRKHKNKTNATAEQLENLPPVELRGYLERKQELQTGGKKATMRSWKFFYTVLCGQLLCFFKDEEDFLEQKAASPPINILQASVAPAIDYTKKKHVLRLVTRDNAEYLLAAESDSNMRDWVNKIAFHAQLPPSMQLLSYDIHKPDGGPNKPPVPPRQMLNTSSNAPLVEEDSEGPIYQNRVSVVPSYETPVQSSVNNRHSMPVNGANGYRHSSHEGHARAPRQYPRPPPYEAHAWRQMQPTFQAPPGGMYRNHPHHYPQPPVSPSKHQYRNTDGGYAVNSQQYRQYYSSTSSFDAGRMKSGEMRHFGSSLDGVDGVAGSRQPYSEIIRRGGTSTLPPSASMGGMPPPQPRRNTGDSSTMAGQRPQSAMEADSDSDVNGGDRKKRNSVMSKLFRRKGSGAQV